MTDKYGRLVKELFELNQCDCGYLNNDILKFEYYTKEFSGPKHFWGMKIYYIGGDGKVLVFEAFLDYNIRWVYEWYYPKHSIIINYLKYKLESRENELSDGLMKLEESIICEGGEVAVYQDENISKDYDDSWRAKDPWYI